MRGVPIQTSLQEIDKRLNNLDLHAGPTDQLRDLVIALTDVVGIHERHLTDIDTLIAEKTGGRCTDC